ncbi:Membrane-bound transcription factor site-2 protease [Linnemannia zychae]|nr:Membrane-bound transcription factor site-2 protease [Linnemannia zychae]
MGLLNLLVPFLATWFGIHAFLFLLQRFLNRPNLPVGPGSGPEYELLPTVSSTNGGQSGQGTTSKPGLSSSGLLVKPFNVRFSTTGLNSFFFRLGNSPKLAQFWRVWYGLGVVFGLLAMIVGWGLLLYAAFQLVSVAVAALMNLWPLRSSESSTSHDPLPVNKFRKREVVIDSALATSASGSSGDSDMVLIPMIPGVTLPLSHLPYYLIALLVSGVIHEAGHAIAAAREKTQVSSTGIFLYILYPGAFVDIPSRALAIMSPIQQLRVVCAGVWHNVVLFAVAGIFLSSGAFQVSLQIIGWKQMDNGVSVVSVAQSSPLYSHLRVGSIITKVNDITLLSKPLDVWESSLLPPTPGQKQTRKESGFCIPQNLLFSRASDCCLFTPSTPFGHSSDASISCFTPYDPSSTESIPHEDGSDRILAKNGQCLPSVDILGDPSPVRCTLGTPCPGDSVCYRPFSAYLTGSMVRIYYQLPSWEKSGSNDISKGTSSPQKEQVVLYQGDPKDIWETVEVTSMAARWSFLPLWLPEAILHTIQYTMSFSLALSILNIVPARHLDGHHTLKAFAALVFSIIQSYKSTQSLQESFSECLLDNGSVLTAASSGLATATFPKGSKASFTQKHPHKELIPLVMLGGDDDDDDFDSLTPRTIRLREPTPPPKRLTPASSSQQRQRPRQQQSLSHSQSQKQQRPQNSRTPNKSQLEQTQRMTGPALSPSLVIAAPLTTKPRLGLPLSLKKPAPKYTPSSQADLRTNELSTQSSVAHLTTATTSTTNTTTTTVVATSPLRNSPPSSDVGKETVMIVLDSESEGESDVDITELFAPPSSVSPEVTLSSTQIGGVWRSQTHSANCSGQDNKRTSPISIAYTRPQNTQESVASSQGSVDLCQDLVQSDTNQTNNDSSAPTSPARRPELNLMEDEQDCEPIRWSPSPGIESPNISDLVATTVAASSVTSGESTLSRITPTSPISVILDDDDVPDDDAYAQTAYDVESSIIGRTQTDDIVECVICGKRLTHLDSARVEYHVNNCIDEQQQQLDAEQSLDLKTDFPRAPSSQHDFAGTQVDYLARVKRCPICKLDWPLKGKGKASTVAPARKARQKVEHMKRCAKLNKRTIQSVLYQVRLLKERYERSLMLGTSMESASQDAGRESGHEEESQPLEETNAEELQLQARPKSKTNMIKQQVVSLADDADTAFASDAIIATVHAPAPVLPKITKLQRMHQDQQDDGLQLALAISMSMSDISSGASAGVKSGPPSGTPDPSTTWLMTPNVVKGVKRRKQTDRDRNETTVLPYAEVKHLIQSNVHALLFPEVENSNHSKLSNDGRNNKGALMRTPPWGPSRFTGTAEDVDIEMTLSQASESHTTSPTKSLWSLSHLKDTRGVDLQEDVPVRSERETSLVRSEPAPRLTFDKEKYVARFMKNYIRQSPDATEEAKATDSTTPKQGSSSKYASPLWSVSRSRRMSFKDQRKEVAEGSFKALSSEIVGHLDEMQRTIQKAKRVAYVKIIESIERHPDAAVSLTPPKLRGPLSPIIIEELGAQTDDTLGDEIGTLSQDIYQDPSSPLLRYSKTSELRDPVPPRPLDASLSPSSPSSCIDPAEEQIDSPVREALSQDLNRSCNMDDTVHSPAMGDYDAYQEGDNANMNEVLAYPPSPSSRPEKPPPQEPKSPPARRARTPPSKTSRNYLDLSSSPVSPPLARTSVVKPSIPSAKPASRRKKTTTRAPSPPTSPSLSLAELPPPLDFAGLGYHKAGELKKLEEEEVAKWAEVKTPKKSRRSNKAFAMVDGNSPSARMSGRPRELLGQLQSQAGQEKSQRRRALALESIQLDPLPPTSAVGGEGGLEELDNWPTVSQRIAARRAAALQVDDQDQPLASSLSSQPSLSQLLNSPRRAAAAARPVSSELVESYRKAATRVRNAGFGSGTNMRYTSTLAFTQIPTQSENLSQSQTGSQTPSKSQARSKAKAEAFAAEAAKAVETMKAQVTMPKYSLMTIETLRMYAVGFGLKATSKKLLAEQLSAIWENVHSDMEKTGEREGGDVEGDVGGSSTGESSGRGGQLQSGARQEQDRDWDKPSTQSKDLPQSNRAPSPSPFQSVDDTAPGYMSPILSDNDHTYDHMFENNDNYDNNDYDNNMDYDNSYHNFDNGRLQADSHGYNGAYVENYVGSDREELFVNAKRGGGSGSSSVRGGTSSYRETSGRYEDTADDDGGIEADFEMDDGDCDELDEDNSQDGESDDEDGGDENLEALDQEEPAITPLTLERQLFDFLSKAPHFRKQYLTYKPLDLEQVWEECSAAKIKCTRQQVRQFLDKQSIICFIPAHSTLQSWRKTRAKKQKRTHP